jgi:hypothetical protein
MCGRPPDHFDACWCGFCSRPRDKNAVELGCPRCHTKLPATADPVTACRRCDVELVIVCEHVFVRSELLKGKPLLEELDRLSAMAEARRNAP